MIYNIKFSIIFLFGLFFLTFPSLAADSWSEILKQAKGQTVYFNAWGGSPTINDYIKTVGLQAKKKYDIKLVQVKVNDIAETVSRILTEKTAGNLEKGKVDLMWLNGENFWTMKDNNLLYGPFLEKLPNSKLLNIENPVIKYDFTMPTLGYESPWGLSQLVFIYDSARLKNPPKSAATLLAYAKKNPGRLTYPQPPDFTGTTFLKQMLYELVPDKKILLNPVTQANYQQQTKKFWQFIEELTPLLWQKGKKYPRNATDQRNLLNQKIVDLSYSFAPASAASDVLGGYLPETVRTYVLAKGTIGNTHFVAIPFNATAKAGAMVIANLLLSPAEQLSKLKPENWGDFTVLDLKKLSRTWQEEFERVDLGAATLKPSQLGEPLPEPHPDWMIKTEAEWKKRFILGS